MKINLSIVSRINTKGKQSKVEHIEIKQRNVNVPIAHTKELFPAHMCIHIQII